QRIVGTATVILAPADRFRKLVDPLRVHGVRVAVRDASPLRMLRLDGGAAATGAADETLNPLPTLVVTPTPTPAPLAEGPQISLTTLPPLDVKFGFAAPRVDQTWGGNPIVMGGVRYAHGVGTHAWCRMTYAVPPNATTFQAIVGLSDEIKHCKEAAVS